MAFDAKAIAEMKEYLEKIVSSADGTSPQVFDFLNALYEGAVRERDRAVNQQAKLESHYNNQVLHNPQAQPVHNFWNKTMEEKYPQETREKHWKEYQ